VKICRRVWPVGEFMKKGINKKKFGYISPICPEAPSTDLHQIWRSRRGRRRNHLYQIFWWSVKRRLFCGGSKIAISHWQSQSPLTQGWRYRAARDDWDLPVLSAPDSVPWTPWISTTQYNTLTNCLPQLTGTPCTKVTWNMNMYMWRPDMDAQCNKLATVVRRTKLTTFATLKVLRPNFSQSALWDKVTDGYPHFFPCCLLMSLMSENKHYKGV